MTGSCIFCKIAAKEIPTDIVFENADVIAFKDLSPQAPTHILIIPKIHISTTEDINDSNSNIAGRMILAASEIAKGLKLEGYRLVFNCNEIAGQTVFHVHCHLLGGRNFGWPPG